MVSATTARPIRIFSRANVASCADGQKDPTLRRRREANAHPFIRDEAYARTSAIEGTPVQTQGRSAP
jgi:hypothetical protein